MLTLPASVRVYLASAPVDMRKGFHGLTEIVRGQWRRDVYSGHLFAFVGRRRDLAKILAWDRGGFVLYAKRLERNRFKLPKVTAAATHIEIDATQLAMLLDGIDLGGVRRPLHWRPEEPRDPQPTF